MGQFGNGNKAAQGHSKAGIAGRPSDWLKAKCRRITKKDKLIEFLADVASGKDIEQVVTENGVTIQIPAPIKERIKAVEILLNRGFGKVESDTPEAPKTPGDSVRNVEAAMKVLKELESYGQSRAA